jgi:subtilisin family serine protease
VSVTLHAGDAEELPAHAIGGAAARRLPGAEAWPERVDRVWAFGGSTGAGATVCVVDSGVDAGHPLVGGVRQAVSVTVEDGETRVADLHALTDAAYFRLRETSLVD